MPPAWRHEGAMAVEFVVATQSSELSVTLDWSGDLLSALGMGRQVTFQNWHKSAGGVNGFENI